MNITLWFNSVVGNKGSWRNERKQRAFFTIYHSISADILKITATTTKTFGFLETSWKIEKS